VYVYIHLCGQCWCIYRYKMSDNEDDPLPEKCVENMKPQTFVGMLSRRSVSSNTEYGENTNWELVYNSAVTAGMMP